jgi:hypothetical protein
LKIEDIRQAVYYEIYRKTHSIFGVSLAVKME